MKSNLVTDKAALRGPSAVGTGLAIPLAILVLALIASVVVLWQWETRPTTDAVSVALSPGENPELLVARRAMAERSRLDYEAARNEPSFLAANPELLKAAPQVVKRAPADERAFLAANPELSAARRYAGQRWGE